MDVVVNALLQLQQLDNVVNNFTFRQLEIFRSWQFEVSGKVQCFQCCQVVQQSHLLCDECGMFAKVFKIDWFSIGGDFAGDAVDSVKRKIKN